MLAFVLLLSSVSHASSAAPASAYLDNGVDVDAELDRLSVDEKVGQLLLLGFGGTRVDDTVAHFLDEMKPGGIALFSRNIETLDQTMHLIHESREHDPGPSGHRVPMFVAVDQEGGTVVRIKKGATILPSAMALGAAHDVELARRAGRDVGHDLHALGFNMNLAPVLDVNSNPNNPVIGIRAFGSEPELVADVGVAYIQGMQSEGVLAVAKHFPGHGDTDSDSHYHLPVLHHDRARLDAVELLPFTRAFAEGLDAIMTAHIALPAIGTEAERDLPATLNASVLTGLLRDQLAWDGLVITDGLEMQGIVERFGSGEAAVRAVIAGADMVMVLWFPEKKREVREALLEAVKSGRIPQSRLDQAVRHVLVAKAKRGLFDAQPTMAEGLRSLDAKEQKAVADTIAQKAITIVKNEGGVLPIKRTQKVVVASTEPVFLEVVAHHADAKTLHLGSAPTRERVQRDAATLVELANGVSVVVVAMQTGENLPVIAELRRAYPDVRIVLVSFGSPYLIERVPGVDGYVCAFGFREDSERAAGRVVMGLVRAEGKSPVSFGGPRLGQAP